MSRAVTRGTISDGVSGFGRPGPGVARRSSLGGVHGDQGHALHRWRVGGAVHVEHDRGGQPHHRRGHRPRARGRRGRRRQGRRGRQGRAGRAVPAAAAPTSGPTYIVKLSQAIQARSGELAEIITAEMGSPSSCSLMGQVFAPTMVLDGCAELARTFPFEEIRPGVLGPVLVRKEPVGVAAGIIPWNVPLFIVALKLGAGPGRRVADGPEAVARDAARRLHPGRDPRRDRAAQGHGVDPARRPRGRRVPRAPPRRRQGRASPARPRPAARSAPSAASCSSACTLELGGKSAAIVLDDADLAAAIPLLMPGAS